MNRYARKALGSLPLDGALRYRRDLALRAVVHVDAQNYGGFCNHLLCPGCNNCNSGWPTDLVLVQCRCGLWLASATLSTPRPETTIYGTTAANR